MPTAYLLAGLIALCPLVCGAVDLAFGSHSHSTALGPPAPGECPESSDNCICHGAVVRPGDGKVVVLGLCVPDALPDLPRLAPPHPVPNLTWDGSPGGLAALGDSLTVRSFLQNFRC
jgi:hypothetical protein